MSFQLPSNVPSVSGAQRAYEDGHWRASSKGSSASDHYSTSHSRGGGIGSKLNDYFKEDQELPMYKDKPHYPARRKAGTLQKKRTYAIILFVVLLFWWFAGPTRRREQVGVDRAGRKGSSGGGGGGGGGLWSWLSGSATYDDGIDWNERRERVKSAFITSWDGYQKYAWGLDEYYPVSKRGRNMVEGGMGWIIVDALDTMIMMNLTSQVKHARDWIATSLHYDADHDVNTFETTIRMLGGLLSAHYLSTTYPDLAPLTDDDANQPGEDLYIEKATDLASRLLGAFDSPTGIPYASVNLNKSIGIASLGDGGASSTAEAATLQLEFKYLAKLTGEPHFWETAEKVVAIIDAQQREDGLLPIYISPVSGQFRGENIRLGSRGDSYYEYLIKQYLQTSEGEPVYLDMWNEALEGIKKHLLTYTKHSSLTILGERQRGLRQPLTPKMDHLVCFIPSTIALAVTGGETVAAAKERLGAAWTAKHDEDLQLAKELMKTCWGMYKAMATGLAPEISYFRIDDPPRPWTPGGGDAADTLTTLDTSQDADWRQDYDIHANDVHNLQRPEAVESLFYLYRITGEPVYREWGWEMFTSFIEYTKVMHQYGEHHERNPVYGFTSLDNANKIPPTHRDNMESFWLAETLKYFYLLFGPVDDFPLDKIVINTEAHFFPRFEMGRVFKTGWRRRPRSPPRLTSTPPASDPSAPLPAEEEKVPVDELQQQQQQQQEAEPEGGHLVNAD